MQYSENLVVFGQVPTEAATNFRVRRCTVQSYRGTSHERKNHWPRAKALIGVYIQVQYFALPQEARIPASGSQIPSVAGLGSRHALLDPLVFSFIQYNTPYSTTIYTIEDTLKPTQSTLTQR